MTRRTYFVTAETVRLDLSEGDYVVVKTGLSYGESYHLQGQMYGRLAEGADPTVDLEVAAIEYLATWIVDWSFTDNGDPPKPVPVGRDAIRALEPNLANEIQSALAAHIHAASLGKATNGRPKRAARST